MRNVYLLILITFIATITGCANNANIDSGDAFWKNKPKTVVIVTTKTGQPTYADENARNYGAIGGLVSLIASQQMETHLNQMDLNWYYQGLAEKFQTALGKENIKAVIAQEHPYPEGGSLFDKPSLNRVQLAGEYNADEILVLALPFYGARTPQGTLFSGIPPLEGTCVLFAELSDPQHQTIYWRRTSRVTKPVPGSVNQPPDFPNLTQTIMDSRQLAEDELLDSFMSGR